MSELMKRSRACEQPSYQDPNGDGSATPVIVTIFCPSCGDVSENETVHIDWMSLDMPIDGVAIVDKTWTCSICGCEFNYKVRWSPEIHITKVATRLP